MGTFDVKQFCSEPSIGLLRDQVILKDQWKYMAIHFDIPFENTCSKEQIKNLVLEDLVKKQLLPPEAIDEFTPMTSTSQMSLQSPTNEEVKDQFSPEYHDQNLPLKDLSFNMNMNLSKPN